MEKAIKLLRSRRVPVFEPGELDYERSVATSNLLFRFSRPNCVVLPESASHVQFIVREAKKQGLEVTIKCNGHSYAGHSTAAGGISLDLRRMNTVELDFDAKTVTMDAGCQWGHAYKTLVNGHYDGFMINGGRCPFVGVSGFILGGGLCPFTRTLGMGSDALMEATVVTADGRLVTVGESDPPGSNEAKLFWALRGAGGGNFGVLVEMKLKVHELQNKEVVAGRYQWFPNPGDIKATMDKFYTADWPEEMTIDSTWMCDLRATSGDGVRFLVYYDGPKDKFDSIIDSHVDHPELNKQLKRRSMLEKSTRFLHETLVSQWSEETTRAFPSNRTYSIYSSFAFDNKEKRIINTATYLIRKRMERFRKRYREEKVAFLVTWIHSGGKAREKKPSDTAFFWREAVYHVYITVEWEDKWMEKDMRKFYGRVKKELRPLSLRHKAAYINYPDGAMSKDHEKAYFGDNRAELRRVKKIWDQDNFFKWAQGVQHPLDRSVGEGSGVVDTSYGGGLDKKEIDEEELNEEELDEEELNEEELDVGELDAEESDEEESDEEDMTDAIAREQWESFKVKDFAKEMANLGFSEQ